MSIVANHLCKAYGRFAALDDVSVSFETGKLVALLGPSGSGKTTLLRILAGLEIPDPHPRLSIQFHGRDVTQTKPGERGVGMVFQHYALFRHMTIAQNIAFGLNARPRAKRPPKEEIRARAEKLLQLVQLESLGHRYPHQLSGGQRQRVALARALAIEPQVLLLDEPFGALDARVRKDLRRWLRSFHEAMGITTVFVTHDQEEALELADEIVILNQGRIEQIGGPQQIYDEPGSPFTCEFLGNVNRLENWRGSSAPVYVRPHEIEVGFAADEGVEATAHVRHVFAAGPSARLHLRLASGQFLDAEISRAQLESMALDEGDEVGLRIRTSRHFARETVAAC
ncbi:MAG: TOBE-like domain-containing protein [Chthoniobacteraceae bacterium]